MKYINTYPDENTYNSSSSTLSKPHVGYIIADNEVKYAPIPDYSKQYLTFEALESGTFTLTVPANVDSTYMTSVSYSTDDGANWVTTMIDNTAQTITTPTINAGDKVLWKGIGNALGGGSAFSATGNFNASGNIMSLLYGDNFVNQSSFPSGSESNLTYLFGGAVKLISAANLVLPATTLANQCYTNMFQDCTALTTAPILPATTLAESCYQSMFSGCTSLTTAPSILPATTLAVNCYSSMFSGCTSLTTVPSNYLPATALVDGCYDSMFMGCTSLQTAPELPAPTLADYCYCNMFEGCTSLTTAPELPATTLAYGCYNGMFADCSNLNSITMLATNIPEDASIEYLGEWVLNVAATGTFTKAAEITNLETGISGIPSGWTVIDA